MKLNKNLKVGDYAKVIGNTGEHEFFIGEIIKIKEVMEGTYVYYDCVGENGEAWFLDDEELSKI